MANQTRFSSSWLPYNKQISANKLRLNPSEALRTYSTKDFQADFDCYSCDNFWHVPLPDQPAEIVTRF